MALIIIHMDNGHLCIRNNYGNLKKLLHQLKLKFVQYEYIKHSKSAALSQMFEDYFWFLGN